jgi:hypothetical protein
MIIIISMPLIIVLILILIIIIILLLLILPTILPLILYQCNGVCAKVREKVEYSEKNGNIQVSAGPKSGFCMLP